MQELAALTEVAPSVLMVGGTQFGFVVRRHLALGYELTLVMGVRTRVTEFASTVVQDVAAHHGFGLGILRFGGRFS